MIYLYFGFLILVMGFFFGYQVGVTKGIDIVHQANCEIDFSNTAYSQISGDCIKYFKK